MKKESFDAAFEQIEIAKKLLSEHAETYNKVDFRKIYAVLNGMKHALILSYLVQIKKAIKTHEPGMFGIERTKYLEIISDLNFLKDNEMLDVVAYRIAEKISDLDTDGVACNFLCRLRPEGRSTTIQIQFDFVQDKEAELR